MSTMEPPAAAESPDRAQLTVTPVIPVAAPALIGREKEYVLDCLDTTWISSTGAYVDAFEREFAGLCHAGHAVSCMNGTAALHLALVGLGVGPGDEVVCPTLTYVATANAIAYCGATPVLVDSDPRTWNLDAAKAADAISDRTKAIIAVHLYGHPADLDPILEVARQHGLHVIEDAAEAHGAKYRGSTVGSLADVGVFSFYGNKIITTGEGGMVVTNDDDLAARIRLLRGQGQDPDRRYWFPVRGFNYRMTNIAAAIGLAQLENFEWHQRRRMDNADWYREILRDCEHAEVAPVAEWATHAHWMNCVLVDEALAPSRDHVMALLGDAGIETRPFFRPMHTLPMYQSAGGFPIADDLSARGINLPSGAGLSRTDIQYVCDELRRALNAITSAA